MYSTILYCIENGLVGTYIRMLTLRVSLERQKKSGTLGRGSGCLGESERKTLTVHAFVLFTYFIIYMYLLPIQKHFFFNINHLKTQTCEFGKDTPEREATSCSGRASSEDQA